MGWLVTLIVGGIIGWLAGLILGKDVPFGIIGNIIAGLIGAAIANALNLNISGIELGGIDIVGGLLGALILIIIVSFIMKALGGNRA